VPSAFNPQSFEDVLKHDLCRFIEGDVKKKTAVFCPSPHGEGSPYCDQHRALCVTRVREYPYVVE
jgi:hypothetical protein